MKVQEVLRLVDWLQEEELTRRPQVIMNRMNFDEATELFTKIKRDGRIEVGSESIDAIRDILALVDVTAIISPSRTQGQWVITLYQ